MVEFNMENVQRCLCPGCPVQAGSMCVQEKLNRLKEGSGENPSPEDVPGAYCATGKATCEGLDPKQPCQCGKCEVWKEYNLGEEEPGGYFCVDGESRPR